MIKDQESAEERPRAAWKRQETSHPCTRGREIKAGRVSSRSEKDVEFVNETMRTDQIQSIITRIEMVAQDLIQTASGDDAQ